MEPHTLSKQTKYRVPRTKSSPAWLQATDTDTVVFVAFSLYIFVLTRPYNARTATRYKVLLTGQRMRCICMHAAGYPKINWCSLPDNVCAWEMILVEKSNRCSKVEPLQVSASRARVVSRRFTVYHSFPPIVEQAWLGPLQKEYLAWHGGDRASTLEVFLQLYISLGTDSPQYRGQSRPTKH